MGEAVTFVWCALNAAPKSLYRFYRVLYYHSFADNCCVATEKRFSGKHLAETGCTNNNLTLKEIGGRAAEPEGYLYRRVPHAICGPWERQNVWCSF